MGKLITLTSLSPTLDLSECSDGFWLYDKTRSMNLSMRAKTPTAALVGALKYYQERLLRVEQEYKLLREKVDAFVGQIVDEPEDEDY